MKPGNFTVDLFRAGRQIASGVHAKIEDVGLSGSARTKLSGSALIEGEYPALVCDAELLMVYRDGTTDAVNISGFALSRAGTLVRFREVK